MGKTAQKSSFNESYVIQRVLKCSALRPQAMWKILHLDGSTSVNDYCIMQ